MFIIKQDPQNGRAELLGHRQKGFTTVLKVDFRLKKNLRMQMTRVLKRKRQVP